MSSAAMLSDARECCNLSRDPRAAISTSAYAVS